MRRKVVYGAAVVGAVVAAGVAARRGGSTVVEGVDELLALPDGEDSTVTASDGASLAVRIAGPEGAPVVVLSHCWTGSRGVWAPVARTLVARGLRVVLWEQRGHGSSTVGSDAISVERLGDDLRDVLAAVDVRDAVLVGHSMGGMTVQSFAVRHPDELRARARALVLVATASHGLGRGGRADALAAAVVGSAVLGRAMGGPRGSRLVRGSVGRSAVGSHLAATAQLFAATSAVTRRDCLVAMQRMDLRDGLRALDIPTTVLVGGRDRLTVPALAEEIVRCIPGARLITLPDAGHMLPFEAPDAIVAAIEEAVAARSAAAQFVVGKRM